MRRFLAKALATLLVAFSASALAMGLGDIRLNSYLNQRLDAEIELVSAAADETESLRVSLADRAAFERIGLDRPAVLSSLEFEVVRRPNGTAYIKVTSSEPIREPFLTFLIEADWSRGRLLREYTLLLDPPTFAEEEQAAPAEARSPVTQPVPVTPEPVPEPVAEEPPAAEETVAEEPAAVDEPQVAEEQKPVAEEEAIVEQPAEEQVSIPPLEADREEPVYRRAPDMGDSYGPIQRNETLWSIASRLRPDDSITMNQMMVAIYRANPEAFDDNMNRMKQGYILRIPDFDEVTSLGRAEAFREAKRMNDDWNAARGRLAAEDDFRVEEPEADDSLSLVAPEEDVEPEVGTGVGAGGEAGDVGTPGEAAVEVGEDDVDEGAVDLVDDETETSDRLIDVEDESMQALQAGADEEAAAEEPVEEPVEEEATVPPVETMDEADELAVEEDAAAETGLPEEEPVDEPVLDEASEDPAVAAETGDTDETATEDAAAAETEAQPDPVVTRTPEPSLVDKAMSFLLSPVGLGAAGGLLLLILALLFMMQKRRKEAREQAASEMADWLADEEAQEAETTLAAAEESGSEDAGADEETTAFSAADDADDESDDEPGFAESTQMISPDDRPETGGETASDEESGGKSVTLDENDPLSEADFNMAYGLYDQAAEVVQKAADREPDRADLKAKLCEIHFAANNKDGFMEAARGLKEIAGTDGSDWNNVAIMGRQIAPDESLFEEGGAGGGAVDLDFGESEAEVSGDDSDEMDFEKTLIGSESESKQETEAASADSGDDLDFDLDIGEPAAEEPETEASADTGGDLDFDLDMDTGGGDETPASEAPAAEEKEESSDLDVGDLDLGDFDSDASETPAEPAAEPEKPAADEDEFDSDTTQTEFDKALGELSAYVDTNLPEGDAGDEVSQEGGGEDLNLDEFSFDKDSESGGGEDDYDAGGDEDEEGLGEIGTKLDLARAYIDMGDPDGARSILEEVVEDGDEEQKKEAQDLLGKL